MASRERPYHVQHRGRPWHQKRQTSEAIARKRKVQHRTPSSGQQVYSTASAHLSISKHAGDGQSSWYRKDVGNHPPIWSEPFKTMMVLSRERCLRLLLFYGTPLHASDMQGKLWTTSSMFFPRDDREARREMLRTAHMLLERRSTFLRIIKDDHGLSHHRICSQYPFGCGVNGTGGLSSRTINPLRKD